MIFWSNNKKLSIIVINWNSRRKKEKGKQKRGTKRHSHFIYIKKTTQVIFGCFYDSHRSLFSRSTHKLTLSVSLIPRPSPPRRRRLFHSPSPLVSNLLSLSAPPIWNIYFLSSVGLSISLISTLSLSPSAPLGFVHSLIPKPRGRTLNCEERYASILEYAFYFLLEVLVFSIKNKRRQLWKHFSNHKIASSNFFLKY